MSIPKQRQRSFRAVVGLFVLVTLYCSIMQAADKAQTQKQAATKDPALHKARFVDAVTRGEGLMPWQKPGPSPEEITFRRDIEARKDRLLAGIESVEHPALLTKEQIARAKRNIEKTAWGKRWFAARKTRADYVVARNDAWIDHMIPELTPTNPYGATCPNCVGTKSQEGAGLSTFRWSYREPDVIRCRVCGQTYPHADFPETAVLQSPRMGQKITCYLNAEQRANPDDRSGRLAYHWVGRPINVSFTGIIREMKIRFMVGAVRDLAFVYLQTGDSRYAARAVKILRRLAYCYRNWLYHDYWDTVADCDPMYAAWHDRSLKLEWKRHLSAGAYRKDKPEAARMLQNYWGAGRVHPSTDTVSSVAGLCLAFDLTYDAVDAQGKPLWTPETRTLVARDLILEWIMGAEPFLGGRGKAANVNNKAPRVYGSLAAVAKVLGIPEYADVAIRGYEGIRDRSFLADGFSRASPAYTNMYLSCLLLVPDRLHGFTWPKDYSDRQGKVDLFRTDPRLRFMLYAVVDQLQPDGRYAPLSDTTVGGRPSQRIVEIALNYYPEYFRGKMPTIRGGGAPGEYAVFNLEAEAIEADTGFNPPEVFYPAWMTAFLRHGSGPGAAMLAMVANPAGGHRHCDNLAIFYTTGGQTVLGDHGYVCDMPQNGWIKSTLSHNLVVVDDKKQRFSPRVPKLEMMFTSPAASVVECSSNAYSACSRYRRLVAMIKGPSEGTFLVDIFRVTGGRKHAFRVFSEIGASDAEDGAIEMVGVSLPPEKPLPNFAGSLKSEHIFGLRDVRTAKKPDPGWQAIWKQKGRAYRMWMLSTADRVEASHGPGQETRRELGRRVRYVDTVNEGEGLASTFVAVHEPAGSNGSLPIAKAQLLAVPSKAGPEAVAVKIESQWGTFLLLSQFDNETEIDGAKFQGKFGLVLTRPDGKRRLVTSAARTLKIGGLGFAGQPPRFSGKVAKNTESAITPEQPIPEGFPPIPEGCQNYVLLDRGENTTGYAVGSLRPGRITVSRFALEAVKQFDLPALNCLSE